MDFIRERRYLFITGTAGTGKSYLAAVPGNKACPDGYRVIYAGTARLMQQLKSAKAKGTFLPGMKRIERTELLIPDDFGMQAFDSHARGILMTSLKSGTKSVLL
jgi:DNA replication protein DnaC